MPKKSSGGNKGRTFVSAGISIDPETHELAKLRAQKLRMGWSEYVRRCLELDIESDGDMVIKPKVTPSGSDSARKR